LPTNEAASPIRYSRPLRRSTRSIADDYIMGERPTVSKS
jgi:hypothetical protein